MIAFSDELEQSSPELKDSLGAEAGRISSMSPQLFGHHGQLEGAQPVSSALCQTSYPSLLLHTQLGALRHQLQQQHQQQQQVCEDAAANSSECRSRFSTATESAPTSCETSAFRQPRRRRVTPEHITPDVDVTAGENTPGRASPQRLHITDEAKLQTRKTGKLFHSYF